MPVPFEALLPFGVVVVMFTAAGTLASAIKQYENYGVPPRNRLDRWDRMMMARDQRLNGGKLRGQTDQTVAPNEFKTNNIMVLEERPGDKFF